MSKYIALFFIIALGVAAGNLLSNVITAAVVAHQVEAATKEINTESKAVLQRQQKISVEHKALSEAERKRQVKRKMQSRRVSKLGKRLIRECNEWRNNATETRSSYASEQAQRTCKKKEQYISSGSWDKSLDR